MEHIKVGAAVLNQTALDWDGNLERIRLALDKARGEGVGILCLPEMGIPGYDCEDAWLARSVQETSLELLGELLPETRGMIVCLGLPLPWEGALYNVVALAADGELVGFTAKRHLAGEGLYYEPRWFKPWPVGTSTTVEVLGRQVPLGDVDYDCGGLGIGFEICEDAWVSERPGIRLAERGIDIILNPSGSHFAFGKLSTREDFVTRGSRDYQATYIYSNLLGNSAGRAIYDGGALIASGGKIIAAGPRLGFEECYLTTATVPCPKPRTGGDSFEHRAHTRFRPQKTDAHHTSPNALPWETSSHLKEEEFTRAVCLGLFDYLRKSRSRGLVVSMSGGADSSAVMCLGRMTLRLAENQLGLNGLRKRLDYVPGLEDLDGNAMAARLLTGVYQSTRNSSTTTFEAAKAVTEAAGAQFMRFDVDDLVEGYTGQVSQALGRELSWERDDLALQNIQARARAPGVWMVANIKGALLLATSNRSEAAVGYATMDGDTAGGLSPIAGIDKAFLRQWLVWMEKDGPQDLGPVPELAAVNAQTPTAELRPAGAHQTDEDDLMPYPVLDTIERLAIRDKLAPVEIYGRLPELLPQHPPAQLGAWIEKFFRLWCRNQWKRERYAPSFHLDDENLDPKTWCRFPILSGGFERELRELRAAMDGATD